MLLKPFSKCGIVVQLTSDGRGLLLSISPVSALILNKLFGLLDKEYLMLAFAPRSLSVALTVRTFVPDAADCRMRPRNSVLPKSGALSLISWIVTGKVQ